MKLKPETPIWAKLRIMQLESECERLREWIWRLVILGESVLALALLACVINFYAIT